VPATPYALLWHHELTRARLSNLSSALVEVIKSQCHPQILQYERCLKANPAKSETCVGKLEALFQCTEGPEAQQLVAEQQAAAQSS